jgi:hypothetical protein
MTMVAEGSETVFQRQAGIIVHEGLFVELCRAVNREIRDPNGYTGYCIFASAVLQDVLLALGHDAGVMRVECGIFPDDRDRYGVVLGRMRNEGRRQRSGPGMWKGHLVAVADGHLLDASVDQVNGTHYLRFDPLVVSIPQWWFSGGSAAFISVADCCVRYTAYPDRGGFKSAPDFRPSRRKEIVKKLSCQFRQYGGNDGRPCLME